MDPLRARERQGRVRVINGIPSPDARTTLSLLPNQVAGMWLAQHADDVRGDLLDLGAGNQPFRPWYEPLATSVTAIDATPADGIDVVALATRLPIADESFDTVLCTSVLEHVDNPEAAVAEAARVLRPGGRILITVPFLYPTHEAPYDFWRTTHYGLRSILTRHGLIVDDLAAQGGPVLLVAHFLLGGLVQVLSALADKLGPFGSLLLNPLSRWLLAAPQLVVRPLLTHRLSRLSRAASIGYMASAYKPAGWTPGPKT